LSAPAVMTRSTQESQPAASRDRSLESPLRGNSYGRFGGGRAEKDLHMAGTSSHGLPNQHDQGVAWARHPLRL
jgi:hypothetical protein